MTTFRISYLSGLNLGTARGKWPTYPLLRPRSDVKRLALLGEIGDYSTQQYRQFLRHCSERFEKVYLVPGNDEYHHGWIRDVDRDLSSFCRDLGNVTYMKNNLVEDDGVMIAGCILWSCLSREAIEQCSDFGRIRFSNGGRLTPDLYSLFHYYDVAWLREVIEQTSTRPLVILTHHLPSYRLLSRRYEQMTNNSAFATPLEDLCRPNVKLWLCGHSEESFETWIGETYLGYNHGRFIDYGRVASFKV